MGKRIAYYALGATVALVPVYFMGLIVVNLYYLGFDFYSLTSIIFLLSVVYGFFLWAVFGDTKM